LSDNTNAWGTPPAALEALRNTLSAARYPSPYSDELKAELSSYTGVRADSIATGCGSDDVLDCAIRAFAEPGDKLAYTEPTFGMIPVFARLNGLTPVAVPFEKLAGSGRLIYVCSPNNPTGEFISRQAIESLLDQCSSDQVVIVDEAYAEFAGTSIADLTKTRDNLLVARTMSKAFGLAAARVGYALGNTALITMLEKSRGPFKVAAPSEAAAVAALKHDQSWVMEHAALAGEMRVRLVAELRERGLEPLSSAANFVFVPMANAVAVSRRMRENGVAVRAFAEPAGLRITVGPWPMLSEMLLALDAARAA
jgi:histidinol-phosphate aminotransferase